MLLFWITVLLFIKPGDHGQTVVLVHGNSLSARTYKMQFKSKMAEKYRLITFDLPGHGNSEVAKDPATMYSILFFNQVFF